MNIIHYKLIEHERLGDAPFCGALVAAIDCQFNCKNCFNQKIKQVPTMTDDAKVIIKTIANNNFNKGVIFGGLEWTLQYDELIVLATETKHNNLLTMLYTGHNIDWFNKNNLSLDLFDFVKCGQYQENDKTANHIEYGVTLASTNQHIYKLGVDY